MWEVKIFRFVKQSNIKDCASSCIYNLIRYYRGYVNYNNITKRLKITEKGSSIYNVVKTLKSYNFTSDAYECNYDSLNNIKHPFIAYLKIDNYYHYVIVKKIKDDKIYIFDPIRGNIIYSKNKFISEWQSIIIDVIYNGERLREKNSYKRYLFSLTRGNRLLLSFIFTIAIFFTISNLGSTYLLKYIIDSLAVKNIIILIIIFEIIKKIFLLIYNKLMIKANVSLNKNIRENMYKKIFSLPNTKEVKTFNIIYRVDDLSCISEFIFTLPTLLIDLLYVLLILIYFIYFKYFYVYILLLFLFITILYHLFIRNKIFDLFDKERNNYSTLTTKLIEKINLLPIIYKLNVRKEFLNIETKNYDNYLLSHKEINNSMINYNLLLDIIFLIINTIILIVSFKLISQNLISLGDFYINYSLFLMYISSVDNILNFDRLFLSSKNAFRRLIDLYDYDFNKEEFHNYNNLLTKCTFIYDKNSNFIIKHINSNKYTYIYPKEKLLNTSVDNNILFGRNISKEELDKVKRICLIDKFTSKKEKIILARSLLTNNKIIVIDKLLCSFNPKEERTILKNIITEYNKNIVYISSRKNNSDLFKNLVKVKGGKCEKVRCL